MLNLNQNHRESVLGNNSAGSFVKNKTRKKRFLGCSSPEQPKNKKTVLLSDAELEKSN